MVERYIAWRDVRSEMKRTYEEKDENAKAKMAMIEDYLRQHMKAVGTTNLKVAGNTVYTEDVVKPVVEDWPAFGAFVLAQGDVGFMQKRISESSYREYMAEHPGAVMPGVTTTTTREVRIRRANQKD
jgi:hypothetical protein